MKDLEEEPAPTNTSGGETILMNNGSRDTSHSDIQKLQQQLQDIKEQVSKNTTYKKHNSSINIYLYFEITLII